MVNVSTKSKGPTDSEESSLKDGTSYLASFPSDPNAKQFPNSRTVLPGLQQSLSDLWSTLSQPPSYGAREAETTSTGEITTNNHTKSNGSVPTNPAVLASNDEHTNISDAPVIYSTYNSPYRFHLRLPALTAKHCSNIGLKLWVMRKHRTSK